MERAQDKGPGGPCGWPAGWPTFNLADFSGPGFNPLCNELVGLYPYQPGKSVIMLRALEIAKMLFFARSKLWEITATKPGDDLYSPQHIVIRYTYFSICWRARPCPIGEDPSVPIWSNLWTSGGGIPLAYKYNSHWLALTVPKEFSRFLRDGAK